MRYHVPDENAANNDEKQGKLQRFRRAFSSMRTPDDYMGKPATLANYEKEKEKQQKAHFLTKDDEKEAKKTGRSSFRVNSFSPKEKFHKKPVTENEHQRIAAELGEKRRREEREILKRFGAGRDREETPNTGLKSTIKRKLKNTFKVKGPRYAGHYTEEDYHRQKRELDIKHGIEEQPEPPPNIKKRAAQRVKNHFSPPPAIERKSLIYDEEDYLRDKKENEKKRQKYTDSIRKDKEKRKIYQPSSSTFSGSKAKNEELLKQRDELRRQGLEPAEHKRRRIINLNVPSYLDLKKKQELQNRNQRYWRLKRESEKSQKKQRQRIEKEWQKEERDGTFVRTYRPASEGSPPPPPQVSTSYVPLDTVKRDAHKKTGSTSYVDIKDIKYKGNKRSSNAGYVPIEGSDKSGPRTSYVPIETVKYGTHNRGNNTSYVPVEQIQDWRPGPPSLKIKLLRWGKRGAKYTLATGLTTFQYIRNKIFEDDDGDPTVDTTKKSMAKLQLEKEFFEELLVSDIHNSKGPWKLPRERWLKARWGALAGKTYTIRGKTFTIDAALNHKFGYERHVNIYRTFTVNGRTFTFARRYKLGGKYSLAQGIKLGLRFGKYGYYAGVTLKNRLSAEIEGDGVTDIGVGSIAAVNNRILLAREYYQNAKFAYRTSKSGIRTAYRGARWAYGTTSRYASAAYHRIAVPLVRGGFHAARAILTRPVSIFKFALGKLAAVVKGIFAKVLALVGGKTLLIALAVVLLLFIMIAISGALAMLVSSFLMTGEDTVADYRDMVVDLDEGLRVQINQYRNLPFDHIYIHYMNGEGVDTNWQEILALASVYRRQEIDFSEEELALINEIYDKMNYIRTEKSSHTHTRDDGSTYRHSVLDVYVYSLPVSDIIGEYLTEQWEIDWYNRILDNVNTQYPIVNTG